MLIDRIVVFAILALETVSLFWAREMVTGDWAIELTASLRWILDVATGRCSIADTEPPLVEVFRSGDLGL